MTEVMTGFPEKCLLLNPNNKATYRMRPVRTEDAYTYPDRTSLPIKKAEKRLHEIFKCKVSNAFLLRGPYVRWTDKQPSKEILDNATIGMKVDGYEAIKETPLSRIQCEGEPYPLSFIITGEMIFFAIPYAPIEGQEPLGLFLTNGSDVDVCVNGLDKETKCELGLIVAEYKTSGVE